ncbi:MAG: DUF433 domain-containing protein [Chloroflexi bacterium]|nr:DUF433 domain-containing protein [Chloroflexota bacterium]
MATLEGLVDVGALIEQRAGVRGGRPFVAGTGVSVGRVGVLYTGGLSAEAIAEEMRLSLAQAHAAVAVYLLNRDLIDADLAAQDQEYERVAAEWPSLAARV